MFHIYQSILQELNVCVLFRYTNYFWFRLSNSGKKFKSMYRYFGSKKYNKCRGKQNTDRAENKTINNALDHTTSCFQHFLNTRGSIPLKMVVLGNSPDL